jgi:hypothetical protein
VPIVVVEYLVVLQLFGHTRSPLWATIACYVASTPSCSY